jgi:predicted Zn finger-like uncharacterized protein
VYTQCPDCATVFRVTAEVLRAAQGDVRCGVCSTTFNALENLSEQAFRPESDSEAPAPDDSMTVEELPGGENIELSAPVELVAVPDAPAPAVEAVDAEALAMEFHGSAADLDKLFVVENAAIARFDDAAAANGGAAGTESETRVEAEPEVEPEVEADSEPEPAPDLDSTDEHPILVLDERDEPIEQLGDSGEAEDDDAPGESIVLETPPQPAAAAPPRPAAIVPQPATRPTPIPTPASSGHTAPRILIPDEMRKRLAEEAEARASAARDFEPVVDDAPDTGARRWPWVAAVAGLSLLLLLQVIHSERNALVRNPALGPLVAGAYSVFGLTPLAPTDLSAYELRQWGAASDPREAGRLMLRASIINRATYAQPLPLLRLTLQDRYGSTLGERDIGPADYLPGTGMPTLLGPGERADALIRIVDPGTEAVGFELDVCLPASGGVRCANPVKTASQ